VCVSDSRRRRPAGCAYARHCRLLLRAPGLRRELWFGRCEMPWLLLYLYLCLRLRLRLYCTVLYHEKSRPWLQVSTFNRKTPCLINNNSVASFPCYPPPFFPPAPVPQAQLNTLLHMYIPLPSSVTAHDRRAARSPRRTIYEAASVGGGTLGGALGRTRRRARWESCEADVHGEWAPAVLGGWECVAAEMARWGWEGREGRAERSPCGAVATVAGRLRSIFTRWDRGRGCVEEYGVPA